MLQPKIEKKDGQLSWCLETEKIRSWLTLQGGHLGPVEFMTQSNRILNPFHVAPWAENPLPSDPPILQVLRGDFFCMPFGANTQPWNDEYHPIHGESANAVWTFEKSWETKEAVYLWVNLSTRIRPGTIDKIICLRKGETIVYCCHRLKGYEGPMPVGHHAMLRFPLEEKSGLLSFGPRYHGQVYPGIFEDPAKGGYSSLMPGFRFRSLNRVRRMDGEWIDLSAYPTQKGYENIVMLFGDNRPRGLGWSAVSFPSLGYLWFSIKRRDLLTSTLLWMSNGGRHYPPWNGRHFSVLGIEEITAHFHDGIALSVAQNPLNQKGIPTCLNLIKDRPIVIPYAMGCIEIPHTFGRVQKVQMEGYRLVFMDENGNRVTSPWYRKWFNLPEKGIDHLVT